MINSAREYSIHSIFDSEAKISYFVPKYQREYSWKENNWEDLFNDLDEEGQKYFLGPILVINRSDDALKVTPIEIIDGQQRLLTISIIYAAVYERMLSLPENSSNDEDFILEKLNLRNKLIENSKSCQLKFVPQEQSNNKDDYEYLLASVKVLPNMIEKPKNYGSRKISKAYNYFKKRIGDYGYEKLKKFLGIINL